MFPMVAGENLPPLQSKLSSSGKNRNISTNYFYLLFKVSSVARLIVKKLL